MRASPLLFVMAWYGHADASSNEVEAGCVASALSGPAAEDGCNVTLPPALRGGGCAAALARICAGDEGKPLACALCVNANATELRAAGCTVVLGTHDDTYDWCHGVASAPPPVPPAPAPPTPPAPPAPAPSGFPTADDFWSAVAKMVAGGPRLTGTKEHKSFLDDAEATLRGAGFQDVKRDVMDFQRWEAKTQSLVLHQDAGDTAVDVASYWVRSGLTPDEGVSAELTASTTDCAGKIVVVPGSYSGAGGFVSGPSLNKLAASGAVGVVCVVAKQPLAQMKGNYQPFSAKTQAKNIPTVYVAEEVAAAVNAAAAAGAKATLTLSGDVVPDTTSHLHGVLPGQTDEVILLSVHSDGQNAVEENGIPTLLTIAKYFAGLPLTQRKRSLAFAAVTGHMDGDVPHPEAPGFVSMNKDFMAKVVAIVAPEHIGTMEWKATAAGGYEATGEPLTYQVLGGNKALLKVAQAGVDSVGHPIPALTVTQGLMIGTGGAYKIQGYPVIGGMSGPDYLVNIDHGGMDKLDKDRFYSTAKAYMNMVEQLLAGAPVK